MGPSSETRYAVFAYNNFHLMGDSEKYLLGEFGDCASAVAACKRLIDDFLQSARSSAGSSESLLAEYASSGPEPYIESDDSSCRFSAMRYARQRALEIGH